MKQGDDFFIGWEKDAPKMDRRFLLAAGAGLVATGGLLGGGLSMIGPQIGGGVWDQGKSRTLVGALSVDPYPLLRTMESGGARTVFLVGPGKDALAPPSGLVGENVSVTGTLIERGAKALMSVASMTRTDGAGQNLQASTLVDHGAVLLVGEILDAKCWFGAMRPGYGKAHKACASLCARGGLPLAFCRKGECGSDAEPLLFLNADGAAHGPEILPFVADQVAIMGQLVEVGDVRQFRAALDGIRRL